MVMLMRYSLKGERYKRLAAQRRRGRRRERELSNPTLGDTKALVGMATVLFALVTSFSPPLSLRTAVPSPSTCVRTADVQMINLFGNNGARNTPFREFLF